MRYALPILCVLAAGLLAGRPAVADEAEVETGRAWQVLAGIDGARDALDQDRPADAQGQIAEAEIALARLARPDARLKVRLDQAAEALGAGDPLGADRLLAAAAAGLHNGLIARDDSRYPAVHRPPAAYGASGVRRPTGGPE
jgi:hypothetical protein